ncbi:type IV secretion protein Rhs [Moraxella canis]|uniref:type IV secretion protein Rhs n=1 Tax=Moraxella canis TaxID=90239 RepID=UPI000A4FDB42|nr:type IV secretion protein Rhs [Moraxella canis]
MKISCPCRYPAQSRPLSLGERQMALSVFGDALKLDDIRLKTAWWVIQGYAVSPNGHIYFHPKDFCEDFSSQSLVMRAWLIHELVHVWQVQQGIRVFWRALFNRRYRYQWIQGKVFLTYGIEQQARMVEDFYMRRERGKDCSEWYACVPFLKSDLNDTHKQTDAQA